MKKLFLSALLSFGLIGAALAQSPIVPQVPQINSGDLFQDVVNGFPTAQSQYATAAQIGTYGATLGGGNSENTLIGGDFTTNLFAYGSSVGGITTSTSYVANRWFAWGGSSTIVTGSQQTGAADITQAFGASLRIQRTGNNTSQTCVGQVVETANAIRYQGSTAEFDFHALAGSGFSAASSNLAVYIVTGTGADEGSARMAFGINGGGTTPAWTGQQNLGTSSGFLIPISTAWNRYSVAVPIGLTAKEIGVALCWTPTGATPTNDYFEMVGDQLVPNSALTGIAGTAGAALNINDVRAKSFVRRSAAMETTLQQRYYWQSNEVASGATVGVGPLAIGQAISSGTIRFIVQNPVQMRVTPTTTQALGTLVASVATTGTVPLTAIAAFASGASINAVEFLGTLTASSVTSGNASLLLSGNAGGTGFIGANAEE